MPDPMPGSTPEEEINLGKKSQIAKDLEMKRFKSLENPKDGELRAEYMKEVEKAYQSFVGEHGEVKYENLTEYLQLWNKLVTFIDEKQIPTACCDYDLGYRFEVDAILNNIDTNPDDRKQLKDYLLSLGTYSTIHDDIGYKKNMQLANRFSQSCKNPQRMIEAISTFLNESRIHSSITHGPDSILRATISDENFDKFPEPRNMSEAQEAALYNGFPETCIAIWQKEYSPGIATTWNSELHGISYFTDMRGEIAHHNNLEHKPKNTNEDIQEYRQLLFDRIKKEFGVDMMDIEEKIIAET